MSQPTRVSMTVGSTTRNGGEFEFKKISLSLERDLVLAENPIDAYRDIKALLERMVTEFQEPKPVSRVKQEPKTQQIIPPVQNQPVPPSPTVSKLATLQERLGPRLQDLELNDGLDSIIVKPRKYLGDSWKEVNDVVRALGGHWIRGQKPADGSWRIPK